MRAPIIPADETLRLASLYRTGLLEGFAEHRIKALTELASRMLGRPAAALSLVASDRQLLRAGVNLKLTSTTRDESFCGHTILHPDQPMVVEDALLDPRFSDNPLVTARRLPIRFYAGVPVRTAEGYPVGALCVLDHVPGTISDADLQVLRKIAEEIELIIRRQDNDTEEFSSLLTELQQALVMGDLLLQWQAVNDLRTMRTVGHEALVRWARADGTMMKPDQFIPLATTSGLMTRLDRFVLHAAMRRGGGARRRGWHFGQRLRQLARPGACGARRDRHPDAGAYRLGGRSADHRDGRGGDRPRPRPRAAGDAGIEGGRRAARTR